jgi:hypothetical protein
LQIGGIIFIEEPLLPRQAGQVGGAAIAFEGSMETLGGGVGISAATTPNNPAPVEALDDHQVLGINLIPPEDDDI